MKPSVSEVFKLVNNKIKIILRIKALICDIRLSHLAMTIGGHADVVAILLC